MVTHESYKGADGRWLYPEEIEKRADGSAIVKGTEEPVTVGRIESMSKSKRNTVDPGAIINRYGADTARWFILSDNPPERDMEWSESGVAGASRFIGRIWRLAQGMSEAPVQDEAAGKKLRQATHRAIASVTEALEAFTFNVAVAKVHELANTIADSPAAPLAARREAMEALIRLASPMMPHLAEEVWASFNPGAGLVAQLPWLEADPELLRAESVTLAVQVLGKLRGTIEVAVDASDEEVFALAESEPNVIRALDGKPVRKRIHVKGRVVNLVI